MAEKICTQCGYLGKEIGKSSFLGELCVWVLFVFLAFFFLPLILVPIIYTLFRFFGGGRKGHCPSCKSSTMVPLNSPIGKKLYNEYYSDEDDDEEKKAVSEIKNKEFLRCSSCGTFLNTLDQREIKSGKCINCLNRKQ
jgi:hypothetical protein